MTAPAIVSWFALPDQVAFVTGGGRGLGRAICVGFAEAGANIVAVARSADQLEETAQQVRARGRQCLPVPCDVTVRSHVEAAVEKAFQQFGKIDILVNNAGGVYSSVYPVEEMPEEEWDSQLRLNLKAAFLCSQAVGKVMLKQGRGKIINIGSSGGFHAIKGIAPYTAAKAGVHHFTRQLALEWGERGIWVNGIAAGGIRTYSAEVHRQHRIQRGLEVTTLPPFNPDKPPANVCRAAPEEYAPIVLFLASRASDHLTGDILSPGGVALRRS